MSRLTMTSNEIRVSSLLENFLPGKKRVREINDKPDYIHYLKNGKSLGIEIIEFYPLLDNEQGIRSIIDPILKIDKKLTENFEHLISQDYYVVFIIESSKHFIKDYKIVEEILNFPTYAQLNNSKIYLNGNNQFNIILKTDGNKNNPVYGGFILTETFKTLNSNVNQNLVDWLEKHLISKNNKIANYEKTDLTGLAISDMYYSTIFNNEDIHQTEERWKTAFNLFYQQNITKINFDYIYVVTEKNIIPIKGNI